MLGFDVIILGAGPAGSSAAYTAATLGLSVLVVDKARFPRDKLCGGLLTTRSRRIYEHVFGRTWPHGLVTASNHVVFQIAGGRRIDGPRHVTLNFTMRRDYDAHLLGLAAQAGAQVQQETRATCDFAASRITLSDGRAFAYKFLIAADGVNSPTAHALFGTAFNPDAIGFGLEVEIPRSDLADPSNDEIGIDFAAAQWGYGWTFPKAKTLTMGIGGLHRLNPNLRDGLCRYLERRGLNIAKYRVKGHFIPFGDFRNYPCRRNVLFCGDAAGLVDPITGEGIAYAMQSGAIAAQTVARALREEWNARRLARNYAADLGDIVGALRQARLWRWCLFPKPIQNRFAAAFADASDLQRGFLDILSGDRSYRDLPHLFAAQALKGLRRRMRPLVSSR